MKNNYYVYVYIDPRNLEEFYYGKGRGSRKTSHNDYVKNIINEVELSTEKEKIIKSIHKEGLEPIIKVVATNLTESEAFLVEKTLLWRLGKQLTNVSSGHYSNKFRPHNTLHIELNGFDFQNGLYHFNAGEGKHRNWDDFKKYGFISAGQGEKFKDTMLSFNPGDIICAYLNKKGYVGIGRVKEKAKMIRDIKIKNTKLLDLSLKCENMTDNSHDKSKSEYVSIVEWKIKLNKNEGIMPTGFSPLRGVKVTLDNESKRVIFIENQFGINLKDLTR